MRRLSFALLSIALTGAACSAGGGGQTATSLPGLRSAPSSATAALSAATTPAPIVYATPIVITSGGTYTGNWQGTTTTPAVYVNTSSPVVLKNCNVTGPGTLIQGAYHLAVTLTVTGCTGLGTNTGPAGTAPGHFLSASNFTSVIAEHNLLENTGGFGFYGSDVATTGKVQVLYNSLKNVDGLPNGGGACTENGSQPYCHRNFVIVHDMLDDPNIEIAWNQVINTPDKSAMEDVILIQYSSGLATGPIRIHDNYIGGAYDSAPETSMDYTGSGINVADGGTVADAAHATAFVHAYDNQVVNFENYGMGIAAGHDNEIYDNRIITSNLLPGGAQMGKPWTGLLLKNNYNQPASIFYNNTATANVVGDTYTSAYGLRTADCDFFAAGPGLCSAEAPVNTDFVPLSGVQIEPADEAAEFASWLAKIGARGFVMGPQ